MHRVACLLLLIPGTGCNGEPDWSGSLHVWAGEGGVVVLPVPGVPEGSSLLRVGADGSEDTVATEPPSPWVDVDGVLGDCYQLVLDDLALAEGCATELLSNVDAAILPSVLLDEEPLEIELTLDLEPSLPLDGDLLLRRIVLADETEQWLDPECLGELSLDAECWLTDPAALGDAETVVLPAWRPELEADRAEDLGLFLRVRDDEGGEVLLGTEHRVVFVDAYLKWGDLHAHTNLSMDGCEVLEADCVGRYDLPGLDFFDTALDEGMDFAAITDHAEYDLVTLEDGTVLNIWEHTLDLVADGLVLEEQGFLPLLGYEWSLAARVDSSSLDVEQHAGEFVGGHRTVLFEDTSACSRYRIAAATPESDYQKLGSDIVYHLLEDHYEATSLGSLYEELEKAEQECGEQRWVSWFHHPAYLPPNPVSWGLESNRVHAEREILVEVASEHGSSECRDTSLDGCDYNVPAEGERSLHVSWGSVQEALTVGYRLGFIGGTDAHDGRPASLTDGPSATCPSLSPDGHHQTKSPRQLRSGGSVTGVWVRGQFQRMTLWGALHDRRTLAATILPDAVAMAATGSDGQVYLPGGVVDADAFPLWLQVRVDPGAEAEVERLEVVDPRDGAVLAEGDGPGLELELENPGGPAVYVRVRLDLLGDEHRIWLSPLFIDEEEDSTSSR